MFWKRGLGIGFLFIGIYLISIDRILTGAVIGFQEKNTLGLLGILYIIIGFVLIFSTKVLERRVVEKEGGEKEDEDIIYPRQAFKLNSLVDAAKKGRLKQYLSRKKIVYDTSLGSGTYGKHTRFVGLKVPLKNFCRVVHGVSQYSPEYSLKQIHEFEGKVARKGRVLGYDPTNENRVRVYGKSYPALGEPGAYEGQAVDAIVVDIQEKPDGIHIHGFPMNSHKVHKIRFSED